MNVFDIRNNVVDHYAEYMKSFVRISDPEIKGYVEDHLSRGRLWPDPMVQLNPSFAPGGSIDELVSAGALHPLCGDIFRYGKDELNPRGHRLNLHVHQREALQAAQERASYVLTTGTGSGKSLAYFVPIVDRILRDGPGQGIKAIVVYPMNALANSQFGELEKFLGKDESRRPVRFAKYTGQEDHDERDAVLNNPPDILLTNYVMLELIMTRSQDSRIIDQHSQNLNFLVLDELHTYRGRQGADVAMLVRRVRERINNPNLQCIGTSATMASTGTREERRRTIANVASTLFGTTVEPRHVIGETLQWTTSPEPPEREELIRAVQRTGAEVEALTESDFRRDPLARWIEQFFGLTLEEGDLVRQKPKTLQQGVTALAGVTGLEKDDCLHALQRMFLRGYALKSGGRSVFAFRLHQFISRGDTVYSTLDMDRGKRHLAMDAQVFVDGEDGEQRRLFPLAFCRECGEEMFPVHWHGEKGTPGQVEKRQIRDRASRDNDAQRSGYLWLDHEGTFDLLNAVPEDWTEEKNGVQRLKPANRKSAPIPVSVSTDGRIEERNDESGQSGVWFLQAPLAFCPGCGHAWVGQNSDFPKLAELSTEGRDTATTILSLATIQALHEADGLSREAMKLLSFTDNRQDASLQAGHFNDFIKTSVLRGAILGAVQQTGDEGLGSDEIARAIFNALNLPFESYALNDQLPERRRGDVYAALQGVLGYYAFLDLRRGWRVNAPNLEQVGLLKVEYDGLREFCEDDASWAAAHPYLRDATPAVREAICRDVLGFFRRELAIRSDYLDPGSMRQIASKSRAHLRPDSEWALEETDIGTGSTMVVVQNAAPRKDDILRGLTPRSRLGQHIARPSTWDNQIEARLPIPERLSVFESLCEVLEVEGLLVNVQGKPGEEPIYQLQSAYLRWRPGDGTPEVDRTLNRRAEESEAKPNQFFHDFYLEVAASLIDGQGRPPMSSYNAKEHTAQVQTEEREDREDKFRKADISVLYCSPTMELGVDISDLNAVNMRNVPPTPANYAQRSGRAGRSGQPALIVTYATSGSPHDQYYFRNRSQMVAGVVAPPRIDLANEDLVKSHIHAIWLAETKQSLGKTLSDVLELEQEEELPLRPEVDYAFSNEAAFREARGRSQRVMTSIAQYIVDAPWNTDRWLDDLLNRTKADFDRACDRWRTLYRSAKQQLAENHHRRDDPKLDNNAKKMAVTLWIEAGRQLDLLTQEGRVSSDFYSYRYFASEGFLPGYNVPRLPLTAYLPAGRDKGGRDRENDDFVSRGRFVAISEFGPGNHIYYEGNRYVIDRVILPAREGDGSYVRGGKFCNACGYGHIGEINGVEVCQQCGTVLAGNELPIFNLFRMENVTTRRIDRITSDEEERLRMGYELMTAYRFKETEKGLEYSRAELREGDDILADMTYAPTATIWRINLGWRRRKDKTKLGFSMDMTKGRWSRSEITEQADLPENIDITLGASEKEVTARVVPYVEDTRNVLILRPDGQLDSSQLITLGYALKRGIETVYQLESNELALETLPAEGDPTTLLFYEAAEGGAGVLTRLVKDPDAMHEVARHALENAHYRVDGDDIRDVSTEMAHEEGRDDPCVAACYDCLLSYTNQRYHDDLDRRLLPDLLQPWLDATVEAGGGGRSHGEQFEVLLAECESELERDFLRFLHQHGYALPDQAQRFLQNFGTRPDFFFDRDGVYAAVYVDGPYHEYPHRAERDKQVTATLRDNGIDVIRVTSRDRWHDELKPFAHIFGTGTILESSHR